MICIWRMHYIRVIMKLQELGKTPLFDWDMNKKSLDRDNLHGASSALEALVSVNKCAVYNHSTLLEGLEILDDTRGNKMTEGQKDTYLSDEATKLQAMIMSVRNIKKNARSGSRLPRWLRRITGDIIITDEDGENDESELATPPPKKRRKKRRSKSIDKNNETESPKAETEASTPPRLKRKCVVRLSATSDEGTPQPTKRHQGILSLVDVQNDDDDDDKDDDDDDDQKANAPSPEADSSVDVVPYWSHNRSRAVYVNENGSLLLSDPPEVGAHGFVICRFPKSKIIYETEVPNLEIDTLEVRPKAKAKAKGKAQASKRWVRKTKALKPKKDKVGGQRVG